MLSAGKMDATGLGLALAKGPPGSVSANRNARPPRWSAFHEDLEWWPEAGSVSRVANGTSNLHILKVPGKAMNSFSNHTDGRYVILRLVARRVYDILENPER